jgi:hypothetical protein
VKLWLKPLPNQSMRLVRFSPDDGRHTCTDKGQAREEDQYKVAGEKLKMDLCREARQNPEFKVGKKTGLVGSLAMQRKRGSDESLKRLLRYHSAKARGLPKEPQSLDFQLPDSLKFLSIGGEEELILKYDSGLLQRQGRDDGRMGRPSPHSGSEVAVLRILPPRLQQRLKPKPPPQEQTP